jgi:hypothetical protein
MVRDQGQAQKLKAKHKTDNDSRDVNEYLLIQILSTIQIQNLIFE